MRPSRHWGRFAAVLLVLLATVEIALRFPQVRSALPPRTHYYHPAITTRVDALERLIAEGKSVDVLFIGSSIVLTNVQPKVFDRVIDERRGVVSFNAGLPGLWPVSVHLYAEHVWLPTARPRVVVQGIRYAELAATTHAKNETQVWSGHIEPSWRDTDVLTQFYAKAVSNICLLQYRGASVRLLQRFRNGWIDPEDLEYYDPYPTQGHQPLQAVKTRPEEWEPDLPNDGVCGAAGCQVGFDALRRTIAAARRSGSAYVLVNVPEHSIRWSGPGGLDRYRDYIERLRAFADAEGIGFVDPTGGDPFRFDGTPYADLAHMTADGAKAFTTAIAGHLKSLVQVEPRPAVMATSAAASR